MHSTQWVHMLSPVLPLPLFLYFSCLKMVYLICAVSFSLYNISKSILLCPYFASSIMQSCKWLHLQRINICCVFLYSILLCSMITLNITMLSIFNLSFLPDVCISDILLCIVSFHVFFIFSYTLDIIITKKTLWFLLIFSIFLSSILLITCCHCSGIIFSGSIIFYSISRLFMVSSPLLLTILLSILFYLQLSIFCSWYCFLDHVKCYFSLLLSVFVSYFQTLFSLTLLQLSPLCSLIFFWLKAVCNILHIRLGQ